MPGVSSRQSLSKVPVCPSCVLQEVILATFRQRAGRWQARIQRVGYPDVTKTFSTRQDAERWARAVEREQDMGAFVHRGEAERTTLAHLLDRYGKEISPKKRGHKNELWKIAVILRDKIASYSLAALTPKLIADFRDRRLAMVSQGTVRHEINLISAAFNTAIGEWGIGATNPVALIKKPGAGTARTRRITAEEVEAIIRHSASNELPYLLRLGVATGMRRGEMVGLRWDDIDLQRRILVLHTSKTGEGRIVPLSSVAVSVLRGMPRRLDGQVFGSKPNAFSKAMRRAIGRARKAYEAECSKRGEKADSQFLSDIHLHDARHEAISGMFERGLNPMEVASISGHKTMAMLRRYTHLQAEDLAKKLG